MIKMVNKICPICKKEFIPYRNIQKYCSNKCLKVSRKEYLKLYKSLHKKYLKNKNKEYRLNHQEEIKEYRNSHRKEISICHQKYMKNRLKIDNYFRLICNIRSRIRIAIKRNSKKSSSIDLLGCSINRLKIHLEKQFKPGMSWTNYGFYGWHVDHIKPCSSFDLSKLKEQRKCFNWKNLQPLWAEENLQKYINYDK